MNILIELLAPVGSKEALIAAVESGADAVYLAGKMFGARAYAANFTNEELAEAIDFAHKRNVLVDVAVNTIVDNSEFTDLAEYLRFLYTAGADAVIVQDFGAAKLAQTIVPDLPLHASTQMTVHNIEGVKILEAAGFSRVVLARELALADIRAICAAATAEIEVFIHGALCICYSGQCLMSGMIGGRSGNRGRCAQPCRLPYSLINQAGEDLFQNVDAGEYLLSPKDMNTFQLMPELIAAGVSSFKIEGRMKRPEYVAVVVDTYRQRLNACLTQENTALITNQEQKDLAQIFNRDFTDAYLTKRPGRTMMSDRRPNNRGVLVGRVSSYDPRTKQVTIKLSEDLYLQDIVEFWVKIGGRVNTTITKLQVNGKSVQSARANEEVVITIPAAVKDHDRVFKIFDARLMERARGFFQSGAPVRRIAVDIEVKVQIGQPLQIMIVDCDGYLGTATTKFVAEPARQRPLTETSIRKQIERLGTTIFTLRNLQCVIQGEAMVPISEINEARRKAVDMLLTARLKKFQRPALLKSADKTYRQRWLLKGKVTPTKPCLSVSVDTVSKVQIALAAGADVILFGGENFHHQAISAMVYRDVYKMVKAAGKQIIFNTPRILQQWQIAEFKKLFAGFSDLALDGISVHNVATIYLLQPLLAVPLHADSSLNLYNNLAIEFMRELGISCVTLSPELNFTQIERLISSCNMPTECIVHGNLELMISEYCTMGSYLGNLAQGKCTKPCIGQQYWLLDRKGERFPLVTDQYCRMHVLNGKELSMLPHVPRFGYAGVQRIRIEGKYMTEVDLAKWTQLYRQLLSLGEDHPLFIADDFAKVENEQITRGHYFRGVL